MAKSKRSSKKVVIKVGRTKASKKRSRKARRASELASLVNADRKITGQGKYKSKGIGKAMGGAGGAALATAFGLPPQIGSMAGGLLGDLAESGLGSIIEKIFGSGKYEAGTETMPLGHHIQKNSFMLPEQGSHVEFGQDEQGAFIRVCKREFVADILSSTSPYSVQLAMPLTPCNPALSPWMSQLVTLFQEYSYDGLVFEFVSLTSPTITAAAPGLATGGYVGFVTRTNPDLPAPVDKQTALELQEAQTAAPWVSQCHPVECARDMTSQPNLFVEGRTGLPVGASAPLYRHGVTYVIVGDQPTGGVRMGEVWAAQAIKVRYPSLDNPLPVSAKWSLSGVATGVPFAGAIQRLGFNSGITIVATNILQFPSAIGSDRFFLVVSSAGNNLLAGAPNQYGIVSTAANITANVAWTSFGSSAETTVTSNVSNPLDTASRVEGKWIFKVARVATGVVTNNQVQFSLTLSNPSIDFGDLVVVEMTTPELAQGFTSVKPLAMVPYVSKDQLTPYPSSEVEVTKIPAMPFVEFVKEAYKQWLVDYPTATAEQQLALASDLKKVADQFAAGLIGRGIAEKNVGAACQLVSFALV